MKRIALGLLVLLVAGCGPAGPGKKLAADQLRDPGAAQFRNVRTFGEAVCGEINGKNAFGAYVGFRRFISLPAYGDAVIAPEPAGAAGDGYVTFSNRWERECRLDNAGDVNASAVMQRHAQELQRTTQETQQYGGQSPQ